MPPIVPTPPELLTAPSPTTRRMTIYYQDQGTAPVAPLIDGGIDIAQPVLNRYAQYVDERSQVNNIPVVGLPIQPVGFANQQSQEGQRKYIDSIPGAADQFNNNPQTQFPSTTVSTDPLGINYKNTDARGPRNYAINEYNRLAIQFNNSQGHEAVVNETLLTTRGHDPANEFITPEISQNKNDNRITLGSYFYKNASDLSNGVNYAKSSYVSTQPATAAPPPMTIETMKDIGLNIMFEAVQGRAGLDYTVRSTDTVAEVEARMGIPSEQRIGKRVSLGRFTPAFQIKKLTGVEKPNNSNFIDNTDDIQSYGSQYNVYAQFDSLISIGQIALCVAMILAYVLLLSTLTALINALNLIGDNPNAARSFANLENNEKQRLLGASVLQNSGVYPLSQIDAGDIASQFLGTNGIFSYTRHRTEECLNAGIQEFFGFSFSGFGTTSGNEGTGITAGQQLASTSLRVLTESGRLNVILREILRSGITLVEDTALDLTGLASVAGIGNLIRKIRDLKIVRFINVLLGMGDRVKFEFDIRARAQSNINNGNPNNSSLMVTGSNVSYIDSLPDNRSNYISKSRLSNENGLIWSNRKAGMLSLPLFGTPAAFANAGVRKTDENSNDTTNNWKDINLNVTNPSNYESSQIQGNDFTSQVIRGYAAETGRIDPNLVRDVEETLEADFMPFYIHDLRTNEILSFHAFLEEASENFSVEYTSQEGYGRMDKVQIYKGTTRTISVNFKMIAMNPEDHDIMWYKVNRLAMMIYPQWTQGRKITVDNLNFIQPFSQIPGATPVIRLRLGDLYKTNYSKMAVARLFGISTLEDYNVDSSRNNSPREAANAPTANAPTAPPVTSAEEARADKLQRRRVGTSTHDATQSTNRNASSEATYAIGELFAPNDEIVFYSRNFPSLRNYSIIQSIQRSDQTENNIIVRIPTDSQNNSRIIARVVSIGRNSITIKPLKFIYHVPTPPPDVINSLPAYVISGGNGQEARNATITIDQLNNSTILDKDSTASILRRRGRNNRIAETQQQAQQQAQQNLFTPQSFYDENINPVMKAFKSSGGKGLAGVITSFKVDYGEAKGNWGIDGSEYLRAPMFVTVQLEMAVIHDITPGLDAKGIMMAPIWPVGKTSNYFVNDGTNPPNRGIPASPNPTNGPSSNSGGDGNDYFSVDKGDPLYYDRKD